MGENKFKILLVDDEPDILEIISYNLKSNGFEVFTALNGVKAFKKAKSNLPDLIILDVMMPEMDGIETCEEIRKIPCKMSPSSLGDYENYTFSIYPNPSSDYVKITLPQLNETANIQVFDKLGKMNFSDIANDLNNYKLDVSNFRSGVYFVTISTMNIRVSNKFIKL